MQAWNFFFGKALKGQDAKTFPPFPQSYSLINDCHLFNFFNFRQPLKAVDTIGNCQRLAFTVGVSQHMHKITNL